MRRSKILLVISCLATVGACGSIVRTPASLETVRIEIGKMTKREVIDAIGLPNRVERQEMDGRKAENWLYFRKPDQSVVLVAGPQGSTAQFVTNRTAAPRRDIAFIITFVESDVVADVTNFMERP